jgi:adenine-specific DNA-methyltransferase
MTSGPLYVKREHAAVRTRDYVFNQLIPYIGNKRKLLDLIGRALRHTRARPGSLFLDLFAGSGVVARMAKTLGYRVMANDWEPYARVSNGC